RLGGNDVPAAFEQIVRHCLEKEPENRFQTARDLAFALNTVSDVPSGRHWTFLGWRSRLPRWASLLTAALVAVAAGLLGGAILKPVHNPVYRRLTFERGTIYSARFTPDGRSCLRRLMEWTTIAALLDPPRLSACAPAGIAACSSAGTIGRERTRDCAPRCPRFRHRRC